MQWISILFLVIAESCFSSYFMTYLFTCGIEIQDFWVVWVLSVPAAYNLTTFTLCFIVEYL